MKYKNRINIGLIGCGGMGRSVARKLITCDERLKIAAVFDPDQRSVAKASDDFGENIQICNRFEDIVEDADIDWVMIASWNSHHCDQVVAAFNAGKHVFCQKPLALNIEDCICMLDAWKASGKLFNIGFTLRYSPHYRKLKELIDAGGIGDVISFEFNETLDFNHGGYIMGDWRRLRENAGPHVLEKCCHDIDIAQWLIGSRAIRVASFGGLDFFKPQNAKLSEKIGLNHNGKKAYSTWDCLVGLDPFKSDKDIIDNQVAIIEYENGVRATFHTNCNAAIPERRMYILGSEGTIRADVIAGTIEIKRIGFETKLETHQLGARGGHGGGDLILANELADSMLTHKIPSVGLIEGLESAVTCFAIDQAMNSGTVVDVKPYWDLAEKSL